MIYIIFGNEEYLVRDKINEIISKNNDSLVSKFDCLNKNSNIDEIVNTCKSVDLFYQKSLVLVKDPYFLITKTDLNDINDILDYCHKPIYENDLIFYSYDNLFDERLKAFKEISANSDVIKLNQLVNRDFYDYARNLIKSYNLNIKNDAAKLLIDSVNFNLSLLNANLNVLSLYPDEIDIDVLNKLISYSSEENVFNLINALISKKVSLAIKFARKLMANDESVLRLISTLANQLRFLYSVAYYKELGKKTNEIMSELNVKSSYRIEKAYESLNNISMNDIENMLTKLADLDYACKVDNEIRDELKLELFIVSLID